MKNKRLAKTGKKLPISGKLKKHLPNENNLLGDASSEKIPVEKTSGFTEKYLNQIETIRIKMILQIIESKGFDAVMPASEQDLELIQRLRTMSPEEFKAFSDLYK